MRDLTQVLQSAAACESKVLPSGLTLLVKPMPGYSGAHVIYATRFGSTDASFTLDKNDGRGPVRIDLPAGVAHFLEHKMFESEEGDAFALYAKTGANANAYTSFDRTSYIFTATGKNDESLDVLLGMVGKPYFTEATIAKEQGIIGQEIRMYDDSADWRLLTGLCQCLYAHHPVRSDIAGHGGEHCPNHPGDALRPAPTLSTSPPTWCWRQRATSRWNSWKPPVPAPG